MKKCCCCKFNNFQLINFFMQFVIFLTNLQRKIPYGKTAVWENIKTHQNPSGILFHKRGFVKGRIEGVKILAVQMILRNTEGVAEALIMHDLSLAQIFDGIPYVGIVTQPQNVVIGHARLLLWCYLVCATFLFFYVYLLEPKSLMLQEFSTFLDRIG